MVYYPNPVNYSLIEVDALGDGYSVKLRWHKAYPNIKTNGLAYHLFYSTNKSTVFTEWVKFVIPGNLTECVISDLTPGQLYFFGLRAIEYNPNIVSVANLPVYNGLHVYPQTLLRSDISASDLVIPLLDTTELSANNLNSGLIQLGAEIINYQSIDTINNNLILTSGSQRGFYGTNARSHTSDGYDGYDYYDPMVSYVLGNDEYLNNKIYSCQCRFDWDKNSFTIVDGYKSVTKDLLNTDLSGSDELLQNFPMYDYAGWHRTPPAAMLSGECTGSYIGGMYYCADGYDGVGRVIRGLSAQDIAMQKQEWLLEATGEPVVLLRRQHTGIVCSCYLPTSEYHDDRCPYCYGTKFVVGWDQFFNPRRSDGRIMVRFDPADEDVKMLDSGLESEFNTSAWTMTVPTLKDKDYIVRFDADDNEEYRYEVMSVNRSRTTLRMQGAQKFRLQRIRKYDPAYQIPVFRNTAMYPATLTTSITNPIGIGAHSHTLVINEAITSVGQINQLTSSDASHNHSVIGGVIMPSLGHTHTFNF